MPTLAKGARRTHNLQSWVAKPKPTAVDVFGRNYHVSCETASAEEEGGGGGGGGGVSFIAGERRGEAKRAIPAFFGRRAKNCGFFLVIDVGAYECPTPDRKLFFAPDGWSPSGRLKCSNWQQ